MSGKIADPTHGRPLRRPMPMSGLAELAAPVNPRTLQGQVSDQEFAQFQGLIRKTAGIHLASTKKPLLCGRLAKRLRSRSISSFGDYYALITSGNEPAELETCVNLLTTNETYFFREARHFDFLREHILAAIAPGTPFRAWSAACSSGEEAYSIAMVAAQRFGTGGAWEVFGSDINTAVLAKAAAGQYPIEGAGKIPAYHLRAYCLEGSGEQGDTFLIDQKLRARVSFSQINLYQPLPRIGQFDVIFLRNTLIYFEPPQKREIVARLMAALKPRGHLFIGHSESLNGIADGLRLQVPAVYRREP